MKTYRTGLFVLLAGAGLVINSVHAQSIGEKSAALTSNASHLRLVDPLDRPHDGYCFDIVGTPGNLRLDLPLFAHNCKPVLTSDSAVVFDSSGRIEFSVPGVCVTVAGINGGALPGASVLLRRCGESTPFLATDALQRFSHRRDGRLELRGSGLCLTVGDRSAPTYSASDRWRALFVADCATASAKYSEWEFATPVKTHRTTQ